MNKIEHSSLGVLPAGGGFGVCRWLLVFACFSILYGTTAQRGVSWQDSGKYQYRVWQGEYEDEGGLALAHPLYIAAGRLARLVPVADLPTRLNWLSAVAMAVMLANLAAGVSLITSVPWTGLAIAGMLGVSHTPWWLGTVAETYPLSAAGLAGELYLLIRLMRRPHWGWLAALAGLNGLGLSVHNLAMLPLLVYVCVVVWLIRRGKLPAWSILPAGGAWLAGAGLILAMTVRQALLSGSYLAAGWSALVGIYSRDVLNVRFAGSMKHNLCLSAINFFSFLTPLAIIGWGRLLRRVGLPLGLAIIAITVIDFAFVLRYSVPDQFMFLLPALIQVGLAAGVGLAELSAGADNRRKIFFIAAGCAMSMLLQTVLVGSAPVLAKRAGITSQRARPLPFRDDVRYWLVPWKHNERSAELFALSALEQADPEGIIVADTTCLPPLLLVRQRHGRWPGVDIQFRNQPLPLNSPAEEIFRAAKGRPIYVVSPIEGYTPRKLLDNSQFEKLPSQVLYRVIPAK